MKKHYLLFSAAAMLLAGCSSSSDAKFQALWNEKAPVAGAAAIQGAGDVKDSPYFKSIDFAKTKPTNTLLILPGFKTAQQTTEFSCGPASVNMVLNYWGLADKSERALAKEMDTRSYECPRSDGGFSSTTESVIAAFEKRGIRCISGKTFNDETTFTAFIREQLQKGNPIVINYATWGNHWAVIIGYDDMGTPVTADDVVILADPYDLGDHCQDGYTICSLERLFYAWFDPGIMHGGTLVEEQFVAPQKPAKK